MAFVETAIFAAVQAHANLCALIGGAAHPRGFPVGEVPDEVTMPYVTWERLSGERQHAMVQDPGLASPRFRFNVWDDSYKGAKTAMEQVIDCFQDWSGTVASVVIQRSFLEGDRDAYDPDTQTHGVSADFVIWHTE